MAIPGGRFSSGHLRNGHAGGRKNGGSSGNGNGRSAWSNARRRRRSRLQQQGLKGLLIVGGLGAIGLVGFLIAGVFAALATAQVGTTAFAVLNRDLPSINQIDQRGAFKSAQIYDRKGTLLWEFYDSEGGRRTVVPISDISQSLIDATLAAEDANFYENPGVDLKGIVRAVFQNLQADETVSGASTITQQLVRNVILDPQERAQRNMSRKIREGLLAYQLTQKYSKTDILQMYLNEVYYGNLAYGVEAAAQTYFSKSARDLTLPEAALIAGLPQAPALYDPLKNPGAAKERQIYVLEQMSRHGFVSEEVAEAAKQARLNYTTLKRDLLAPHWVMYVRDMIEEKYGPRAIYQGGLKIYTTLDLDLNRKLEEVAHNNIDNLAQRDANNTAIVAVNPRTGEILGMVGSMDYYNEDISGQVNVATAQPGRQPGSSIKPLIYLTAFAGDYSPSTVVQDLPISITDDLGRVWSPQNFDKRFRGNVALRSALGNSLNIPAVKVLEHVGIDAAWDMVKRLGITTWTDRNRLGLSLTLGGAEVLPLELAGAYATLANNGLRIPLVAVTKVVDSDGDVLEDYKVPAGEQVVDPRAAYMVTNILSDNNARLITYGPNSMLKTDRPAAAKTGTTDNYRDTWTMGYTANLVVGVWVGNTDGHPMKEVLSSMSAGKIWRESLDAATAFLELPADDFQRPSGLTEAEVCGDSAMRPGQPACYNDIFKIEQAPARGRTYLAGAAPPAPAPVRASAPAAPAPAPVAEPAATARPNANPVPGAINTPAAPPAVPAKPEPAKPEPAKPEPTTTEQRPRAAPATPARNVAPAATPTPKRR
jgi:1A family penicillin-binding protein